MNTSSSAFFSGQVRNGDSMRVNPVNDPLPIEATHLGKKTDYKFEYDPTLLVPVPRQENRSIINIENSKLPFVGVDVWNAYEVSALTTNGLPYCGIAKIVYPCSSEFLIESKSLKLYLNSFNMTKIQKTIDSTARELELRISTDLSNVLKTCVKVKCLSPNLDLNNSNLSMAWHGQYNDLDFIINKQFPDLECYIYNEDPELLIPSKNYEIKEHKFISNSLRSNCKITKQPDWGTVYIKYNSEYCLNPAHLYQYIVSFRNEAHFHEEICETIFKRLFDKLNPKDLLVACFYTRRGGIDINPIRSTSYDYIREFENYIDERLESYKHSRQ